MTTRREALLGAGALLAPRGRAQEPPLSLRGAPRQGGHLIGRTEPRALVFLDGEALTAASADGWFFVGFDRDAPLAAELVVRGARGDARRTIGLARGDYRVTRVDGLPPQTVEPTGPELAERIRHETELKQAGFASRVDADHFRDGFAPPLAALRVTSPWGAQRVLNGTPARPHHGVDLGAEAGTPIMAPAAGTVALAEPDLHFEGGLTLIDHGQGVVSAYLHQSRLLVRPGERVTAGQTLGLVGAKGRASGPHLCWRLKWRDRNLDPMLMLPGAGVGPIDHADR